MLALAVAAPIGSAWVSRRRDMHRARAESIPWAVRDRLAPSFDRGLLQRVEVARIAKIPNPLGGLLSRLTPRGALDLSTVRGMAFIDTIVIADANARPGEDEASLIFHEMVHVVQYQALGTLGFVRAYLAGWLGAGRSYIDNPMEVMAFQLQDRFDAGERVDVEREVRRALARRIKQTV